MNGMILVKGNQDRKSFCRINRNHPSQLYRLIFENDNSVQQTVIEHLLCMSIILDVGEIKIWDMTMRVLLGL